MTRNGFNLRELAAVMNPGLLHRLPPAPDELTIFDALDAGEQGFPTTRPDPDDGCARTRPRVPVASSGKGSGAKGAFLDHTLYFAQPRPSPARLITSTRKDSTE